MNTVPLSTQVQEPTTLAHFPLAKFSYTNNTINHRGPLTWSHVFGINDIFGRFERHNSSSSAKILFRVSRLDEKLEELCITDMLQIYDSQIHSPQDSTKRPPFAVVVKNPCLAVKYPLDNACVRRFQIKFCSDRDYYSALAVLSDINCPFSDSNVSTAQPLRRLSSSLSSSGSYDSAPGVHNGLSEINRTYLRGTSIVPSYPSFRVPSLPSSSSSSTTVCGTSRPFSSSTLSINSSSPVDFRPSTGTASLPLNSLQRPSTSIGFTGYHDTQTLNENIPPRRELPFPNPAAKKPRLAPEPTPTDTASHKLSASRSSVPKTSTAGEFSCSHQPLKLHMDQPKQSLCTDNPNRGALTKGSPSKGNGKPRRTQPLRQLTPQPSWTAQTATKGQENTNRASTTKLDMNETQPPLSSITDLAGYTLVPTESRTAYLQEWLCAHVEDDNFLQLCADVESLWERFAFGK
ncbi:hypothetical protein BJX61DRAFT_552573 [Aspergillus egyptiacus]|nr:hypothetical protein BJX61DRAFT_552573 [Aspergillus egyptiacus]